jgi:hypothetical protein
VFLGGGKSTTFTFCEQGDQSAMKLIFLLMLITIIIASSTLPARKNGSELEAAE